MASAAGTGLKKESMASVASKGLKKAERTRQLLLDAALRVISRKGYTSATVDEIVREAGVSKGVAYYHFKNKAAMATDILDRGLTDLVQRFRTVADAADDAPGALNAMLDLFASELYDNREFASFFMTELWRSGRAWSQDMRAKTEALVKVVSEQLVRGQREGSLRPDVDAEFAAVSIVGMAVTDAMYYAGQEGAPLLDKDSFASRIRDFAHRALAA